MSMHINLSPEMESFIKGKVASGYYGNATEVIRDAIRRLQADEARLLAWKAALKLGNEELDAGESVAYNAATLEDIAREASSPAHEAARPDALP